MEPGGTSTAPPAAAAAAAATAGAEDASGLGRALGCVVGAMVGDAAGGVLEFLGRLPTDEEVEEALTMPGGGVWRLGPGQITDDSEMALSMAAALCCSRPAEGLPLDAVAWSYGRWYSSPPFDIGELQRL